MTSASTTGSVRDVARRLVIPETALAAIRRYCERKTPQEHRDEVRIEYAVRGKNATIFEARAPWKPELGPEWTRQPVAQLRYDPTDHHWRLYFRDRNGRWHPYPEDRVPPTPRLDVLLAELDEDPTGLFWG